VKIVKIIWLVLLILTFSKSNFFPIEKDHFDQRGKIVDLKGENFIVVALRETESDGRFYAIDGDGTCWASGVISSGSKNHRTPTGVFRISYKKRKHMSSKYPDPSGINNMDYSMFFTSRGHALHKGNENFMSHGCIHIAPKDIKMIYNWAYPGMKIVIIRGNYMDFVKTDFQRIYGP